MDINPTDVACADVNGDGHLDLAVTNHNDNTVSILLGSGDGTFQTAVPYQIGAGPYAIQVGDLNGDGNVDVFAVNGSDHTISVLLGNGDGTFQPHVDYAAGSSAGYGLTLGDFNSDGRLDLVAANNNLSSSIFVLLQATTVEISPDRLNFGAQKVGTISSPQTVTLTNTGSFSLSIKGFAIAGIDFSDFVATSTCPAILDAGGSCKFIIRFTPRAKGARRAIFSVSDDGTGNPQQIPLTGKGT